MKLFLFERFLIFLQTATLYNTPRHPAPSITQSQCFVQLRQKTKNRLNFKNEETLLKHFSHLCLLPDVSIFAFYLLLVFLVKPHLMPINFFFFLLFWKNNLFALVLFLFNVYVSGMSPRTRLSSHTLMISASWVLLRFRWSIPLSKWFHPG